VKEKRKKTT